MDIDEVENLKQNYEEFRKGLNLDNIINNEYLNENASNGYKPLLFQTELLSIIFRIKKSFKSWSIEPKCGKQCIKVKDNQTIYNYI